MKTLMRLSIQKSMQLFRASLRFAVFAAMISFQCEFAQSSNDGGPHAEGRSSGGASQGGGSHGPQVHSGGPSLEFSGPSFGSIQHSLRGLQSQLEKNLRFDPILNVNPNRGTFETEIAIDLPPSLAGTPPLNLIYRATDFENVGLGIGWKWSLPRISVNPRGVARVPYISSGSLGHNELTRTGEWAGSVSLSDQQLRLKRDLLAVYAHSQNIAVAQAESQNLQMETYRPMVDESFHLFVRFSVAGNTLGWVVATLDGHRWAFSSNGVPVLFEDTHSNSIRYTWENDFLLHSISDPTQGWHVDFHYSPSSQEYRHFQGTHFVQVPKSIQSIDVGDRVIRFISDDDGYLIRAGYEGGVLPLFQGEYSTQSAAGYQESVPTSINDDRSLYFLNATGERNWVRDAHEGEFLDLYVDLNGDSRTDRVRIHVRDLEQRASATHIDVGSESQYQNALNSLPIHSSVELAVASQQGANASWIRDESLSLPPDVHPIQFRVWRNDPEHRPDHYTSGTSVNPIYFADLNGDGRKDLIYCPEGSETLGVGREIPVDTFQETLSNGGTRTVHRTIQLLAMEVLGMLYPNNYNVNLPRHSLSLEGTRARVYLQEVNEAAVDQIFSRASRNESHQELAPSALLGISHWRQVPASFSCHGGSLLLDANHDGRLDVLTGPNLYLLGENPQQVDRVSFTQAELAQRFFERGDSTFNLNDSGLIVVDADNNGKYELRQARGTAANPFTGRLELVRNGSVEAAQTVSTRKFLTSLHSVFGGQVRLEYELHKGNWVISKLIRDPGVEIESVVSQTQYRYLSPMTDPFRGVFVGYHSTETLQTYSNPHMATRKTRLYYSQDTTPDVSLYSSRSRLNGRLIRRVDGSEQTDLEEELTTWAAWKLDRPGLQMESVPETQSFGHARIYPFQLRVESRVLNGGATESTAVSVQGIFDPARQSNAWATDSHGKLLFPLRIASESSGQGVASSSVDAATLEVERTFLDAQFNEALYLRQPIRKMLLGRSDEEFRAVQRIQYRSETGDPSQVCLDARCDLFEYDFQGRLTRKSSTNGLFETAQYDGQFPLPTFVENLDGREQRRYNRFTGDISELTTRTGSIWRWNYTPDGITKSVYGRESSAAAERLYFSFDGGSPSACQLGAELCHRERTVSVTDKDVDHTWLLDGMGRVVARMAPRSNQEWQQSPLLVYGDDDTVIEERAPQILRAGSPFQIRSLPPYLDRHFDSLGRVSLEQHASGQQVEHSYHHHCHRSVFNRERVFEECSSPLGSLSSQSLGSENIHVRSNAAGDPVEVTELGLHWGFDRFGSVSTSEATANSFSTNWRRQGRSQDALGLIVTSDDDLEWVSDSHGRLIRFSRLIGSRHADALHDLSVQQSYNHGLLSSQSVALAGNQSNPFWINRIDYDGFGNPRSSQAHFAGTSSRLEMAQALEYDIWNRPVRLATQFNGHEQGRLTQVYEQGNLQAIQSERGRLVHDVVRDSLGRIIEYHIGDAGAVVRRSFDGLTSKLLSTTVDAETEGSDQFLWSESLRYNEFNQPVERHTIGRGNHRFDEAFQYDSASYELVSERIQTRAQARDLRGRVAELGGVSLQWSQDNLVKKGDVNFFYDHSGQMIAACPQNGNPQVAPERCFLRLSADSVIVEGELVQLVLFQGVPVAVRVRGNYFPIITDHLGSVRAMLSPSGHTVLWERHYGAWGEKSVRFHENTRTSRERLEFLERVTVWGFAGMIETPYVNDIYFSHSRAYSPIVQQWLSPDPQVKWNPHLLVGNPGNWNGTRYALNRPLEFVDPSGGIVPLVIALETIGTAVVEGMWGIAISSTISGVVVGGYEAASGSPGSRSIYGGMIAAGTAAVAGVGGVVIGTSAGIAFFGGAIIEGTLAGFTTGFVGDAIASGAVSVASQKMENGSVDTIDTIIDSVNPLGHSVLGRSPISPSLGKSGAAAAKAVKYSLDFVIDLMKEMLKDKSKQRGEKSSKERKADPSKSTNSDRNKSGTSKEKSRERHAPLHEKMDSQPVCPSRML